MGKKYDIFFSLKGSELHAENKIQKISIFLEKQVTDGHKERGKQTCSDGQYDG